MEHTWIITESVHVPTKFLTCVDCGYQSTVARPFNINGNEKPIAECAGKFAQWHWEDALIG